MKKIFTLILCLSLFVSSFAFSSNVSAAILNEGIITIDKKTANTGDYVSIPISISENPGIMAITISITYDSKVLQYVDFSKGKVLKDYTVADHPDKNIIRFVSCELTNKYRNGILITLNFKVKDNAEWNFSEISIKYSKGDFCNWYLDKIMPQVISGGVDVEYNGSNCPHKNYSEWKTVTDSTCNSEGVKERVCQKCNHLDTQKIATVGHTYPEEWTIEKVATKDEPGTMVRYCLSCNSFVDRIEYTVEDSEKGEFENQVGTEIPKNDIIEENFQQQNPDKEFTPMNPPSSQKPVDSSNQSSVSQQQSTASQPSSTDSSNIENSKPSIKDVLNGLFGNNESNNGSTSGRNDTNSETSSDSTVNTNSPTVKTSEIKAKIAEVFPNYEVIEESFKTAFIIFILMILF